MLHNLTLATAPAGVEFGIYRDGDNNLDRSQSNVIAQARAVSASDSSIAFTVQDTSGGKGTTATYTLEHGSRGAAHTQDAVDMSDPRNLARFVEKTLDNAERIGAKQTWIDLVDHGAGDGGGLEADSYGGVMPMQSIADAVKRGVELHAQAHPEDAERGVDGVVANQCLMSTLGFADALSHDGVKYLAASPETMVSPGVPSSVAEAIASKGDDPKAMSQAIVRDVMSQKYGVGGESWGPAAAFDVLDLDATKMGDVERSVKSLNDAIASTKSRDQVHALRQDGASVQGMVRFHDATPDMPWHSDRPAIALYSTLASDSRLDEGLRSAAKAAAKDVASLVLAHKESRDFQPFGGSNYADAVGPTVHFPVSKAQVDPWAPNVSETNNRFFSATDARAAERVVA